MDKKIKSNITRKVNENYMRYDNVDDMKSFIFGLEEIEIEEKDMNEAIIHIEKKYNDYLPKLAYKKKNDKIKELTKELIKIKNESYEINGVTLKIDFDEEYNIVKLTKNNATIIEKLIKKDNYIQFAQMIYDYYKLSNISIEDDKDALNAVIRMIDYENSTQAYRMYREDYKTMINGIWNTKETVVLK